MSREVESLRSPPLERFLVVWVWFLGESRDSGLGLGLDT